MLRNAAVTCVAAHEIANHDGGRCYESDDDKRDADGRSSLQPRCEKVSLIYEGTQKENGGVLIIPAEKVCPRVQQMPLRDARYD